MALEHVTLEIVSERDARTDVVDIFHRVEYRTARTVNRRGAIELYFIHIFGKSGVVGTAGIIHIGKHGAIRHGGCGRTHVRRT